MSELPQALIEIFGTIASALVPFLVAYLIRKFKLDVEIAHAKKLEATGIDLVLAIEEFAAARAKAGSPISSGDKLNAFKDGIKRAFKNIDDETIVSLVGSSLMKAGLGAFNARTSSVQTSGSATR